MRLQDKIALITGAGSGIGREAALLFAREGAAVVVVDINDAAGEQTAEEITAAGGRAHYVHCNVAKSRDIQALMRAIEHTFGALHILFNNAAILLPSDGSILTTDEETFDLVLQTNLKSVFLCCKYAIPLMLRAGGGSIINMASFLALMGSAAPEVAYTASKGGVVSLTRTIAIEFAQQGIRANALCPGVVDTAMLGDLFREPAQRIRRMVHIPQGRLALANEIAYAALFLASNESTYITGTTFTVDGGITAAYVTPE